MDDRRSTRLSAVLPVLLSGTDFGGLTFNENTWTIGVNKHGAKLSTSYRLSVGDQITVGNPALGHSTKARVVRVAEKGRGFEIGVELFDPQDIWGAKNPPADWRDNGSEGGSDQGVAKAADAGDPEAPKAGDASKTWGMSDGPLKQPPAQPAESIDFRSQMSLQDPTSGTGEGTKMAAPPAPQFESLSSFLQASRAELKGLLAKTRELQQTSWQVIHSLLEEVHTRLHQELEAASAGFVSHTGKRIQEQASAALEVFGKEASARQTNLLDDALAQWQMAHQKIELSLKEAIEEYQKKLVESSTSALDEIQRKGETLFLRFRNELQKALDDLKTRSVNEVSDHLRQTASELADELRRRAEVGFEILNEQLVVSGTAVVETTQRQIATLSQSALADLAQEACHVVQHQVDLGAGALKDAGDQTRASLGTFLQQSTETYQKQIDELSKTSLEKYRDSSGFLLHDLQTRLDQAARALQHFNMEPVTTDQKQSANLP